MAGPPEPDATTPSQSAIPTSKPTQARTLLVARLHRLFVRGDLESAVALAEALLGTTTDAPTAWTQRRAYARTARRHSMHARAGDVAARDERALARVGETRERLLPTATGAVIGWNLAHCRSLTAGGPMTLRKSRSGVAP